ncbi:uncharacterized protein BO87DRAFT_320692 [Aspergillus neoniger CBS 115656]|uniref:Uncharacterized protein n=1 Tax=Aspergillus neoniger (strain CBS 115656) TaxID=1448310 RepID=A0A318YUN0_ASPNB|nr:hypothetical protein BO87DRAFT_320692 [Aspergillus neoniger CBS 115656]PYH29012.1 hypothetical protein BO87DRAFT_320692 [Aspergillus neoniger CBS 115656]
MPLPVEFKPANMYAKSPEMRAEIQRQVLKCYQENYLGKGKIYDKAVVITFSGDPKEHCTVQFHSGDSMTIEHIYHEDES